MAFTGTLACSTASATNSGVNLKSVGRVLIVIFVPCAKSNDAVYGVYAGSGIINPSFSFNNVIKITLIASEAPTVTMTLSSLSKGKS